LPDRRSTICGSTARTSRGSGSARWAKTLRHSSSATSTAGVVGAAIREIGHQDVDPSGLADDQSRQLGLDHRPIVGHHVRTQLSEYLAQDRPHEGSCLRHQHSKSAQVEDGHGRLLNDSVRVSTRPFKDERRYRSPRVGYQRRLCMGASRLALPSKTLFNLGVRR
jgi:hypothetical protein